MNIAALQNGMILHCRTNTIYGRSIRALLDSWGNHDAILGYIDGQWQAGNSQPGGSRWVPLMDLESRLGREIRYLLPAAWTPQHGHTAVAQWSDRVEGAPYDYLAIARIWIKYALVHLWDRAVGWEWAWYCTEGVAMAYREAGLDVYHKTNPTPKTTEKRLASGELIDLTPDVCGGVRHRFARPVYPSANFHGVVAVC